MSPLAVISGIALVLVVALVVTAEYVRRLNETIVGLRRQLAFKEMRIEGLALERTRELKHHHHNLEAVAKIYRGVTSELNTQVTELTEQIAELHATALPQYKPAADVADEKLADLNTAMAALKPGPVRDSKGRFLRVAK